MFDGIRRPYSVEKIPMPYGVKWSTCPGFGFLLFEILFPSDFRVSIDRFQIISVKSRHYNNYSVVNIGL